MDKVSKETVICALSQFEIVDHMNCDKKISKMYKTPYGFLIEITKFSDFDMYMYYYEKDIGFLNEGNSQGMMCGSDIIKVLKVLKFNPTKLREKSESIKYFENLTGTVAMRKSNDFGKWHISNKNFSMFNNPFELSLGYTRNENQFEIWFLSKETEPRMYQSIASIESAMKSFGYI